MSESGHVGIPPDHQLTTASYNSSIFYDIFLYDVNIEIYDMDHVTSNNYFHWDIHGAMMSPQKTSRLGKPSMEATSPSRIAREFWRTLRGFPWKETGWRKRQGNDDWDILLNPRIVEDLWKLYFFGTILGKIWWCMSIVKGHFHIFSTRQVSDAWDETSLMQRFYLMKSFRILPCIVISTNDYCVYSWDWTEINVNLCFAHEFSAPHVTLLFCMYIYVCCVCLDMCESRIQVLNDCCHPGQSCIT